MFAGDRDSKDICHVGSALFMGNNIKLMCSNQVDTLQQTIWNEKSYDTKHYAEGKAPKGFTPSTYFSYINKDNYPYELIKKDSTTGYCKKGELKRNSPEHYEDWIEVKLSNDYSNIKKVLSGTSEDGSKSGLKTKFQNFKKNIWMCGTQTTNSELYGLTSFKSAKKRQDELPTHVESTGIELTSNSESAPMVRDVAGGGGGHSPSGGSGGSSSISSSPPTYLVSVSHVHRYSRWDKYVAVHTGVPAWKELLDNPSEEDKSSPDVIDIQSDGITQYYRIHFGEVPEGAEANGFDWYFLPSGNHDGVVGWTNPFTRKFNFFTNDMSNNGTSGYSWPFYYDPEAQIDTIDIGTDHKQIKKKKFDGVLTNMWAGCEPVCAIVSKLLKDGLFCSYPWNIGLGYMFRKKSIPKLIFVFANEYDNSFTTDYDYK